MLTQPRLYSTRVRELRYQRQRCSQFTKNSRTNLVTTAGDLLLEYPAKQIVLSGPSGFLGSRVLDCLVDAHNLRREHGEPTGEIVLLSSRPGNVMSQIAKQYGKKAMESIRASRVDYYTQHQVSVWWDHLASLGLHGKDAVFVNLAGVNGPVVGRKDALMDVNYKAPVAAAKACENLGFGHFIQSSDQAVNAERAGQVPYSRANAMADFNFASLTHLPVTIAVLGLLYSTGDSKRGHNLNLTDLARLPLTPILGDGSAPLQPQEVKDAAARIAFLALSDPTARPIQKLNSRELSNLAPMREYTFRRYDAVGPETMTMLELLGKLANYSGNKKGFRPAFIDYRNMERLLNIKSLGNLNRQLVSLIRSEQESEDPIVGDPSVWARLLPPGPHLTQDLRRVKTNLDGLSVGVNSTGPLKGPGGSVGGGHREKGSVDDRVGGLCTVDEAFQREFKENPKPRPFPYGTVLSWAASNPKVVVPALKVLAEVVNSQFKRRPPVE